MIVDWGGGAKEMTLQKPSELESWKRSELGLVLEATEEKSDES